MSGERDTEDNKPNTHGSALIANTGAVKTTADRIDDQTIDKAADILLEFDFEYYERADDNLQELIDHLASQEIDGKPVGAEFAERIVDQIMHPELTKAYDTAEEIPQDWEPDEYELMIVEEILDKQQKAAQLNEELRMSREHAVLAIQKRVSQQAEKPIAKRAIEIMVERIETDKRNFQSDPLTLAESERILTELTQWESENPNASYHKKAWFLLEEVKRDDGQPMNRHQAKALLLRKRAHRIREAIAKRPPEEHRLDPGQLQDIGEEKLYMVDKTTLKVLRKLQKNLKAGKPTGVALQQIEENGKILLPDGREVYFDEEFNGYVCGKVLGQGSFGTVYVAQSIETGEICALKAQNFSDKEERDTIEIESDYHQEAGNLRGVRIVEGEKISQHIMVQKFETGVSSEAFFEDLDDKDVEERERFTFDEFKEFNKKLLESDDTVFDNNDYLMLRMKQFISLTGSVQDLHLKGKVHRDLKEANVMFNENGDCVLIDFGTVLNQGDTAKVIGSPSYMPSNLYPYIYLNKDHTYTGVEDVFSLGCMLERLYIEDLRDALPQSLQQETEDMIRQMKYAHNENTDMPEADVPSIETVMDHLNRVNQYILLQKPLDLFLATPDEVTHYIAAHQVLSQDDTLKDQVQFQVHFANPNKLTSGADAVLLCQLQFRRSFTDVIADGPEGQALMTALHDPNVNSQLMNQYLNSQDLHSLEQIKSFAQQYQRTNNIKNKDLINSLDLMISGREWEHTQAAKQKEIVPKQEKPHKGVLSYFDMKKEKRRQKQQQKSQLTPPNPKKGGGPVSS